MYFDVRGVSPQPRRQKNLVGVPHGVPKHSPPSFEGFLPEDLPCPETPESRQRTPSPRAAERIHTQTRQNTATANAIAYADGYTVTTSSTPHYPYSTPSSTHDAVTAHQYQPNGTTSHTSDQVRCSPRGSTVKTYSATTTYTASSQPPTTAWSHAAQSPNIVSSTQGIVQATATHPRSSVPLASHAAATGIASPPAPSPAPGQAASHDAPYPAGTFVEYKSRTMKDQWILAKVLDFDEKARTYKLDVQPRAAIDRVRLREMSQAETTEAVRLVEVPRTSYPSATPPQTMHRASEAAARVEALPVTSVSPSMQHTSTVRGADMFTTERKDSGLDRTNYRNERSFSGNFDGDTSSARPRLHQVIDPWAAREVTVVDHNHDDRFASLEMELKGARAEIEDLRKAVAMERDRADRERRRADVLQQQLLHPQVRA